MLSPKFEVVDPDPIVKVFYQNAEGRLEEMVTVKSTQDKSCVIALFVPAQVAAVLNNDELKTILKAVAEKNSHLKCFDEESCKECMAFSEGLNAELAKASTPDRFMQTLRDQIKESAASPAPSPAPTTSRKLDEGAFKQEITIVASEVMPYARVPVLLEEVSGDAKPLLKLELKAGAGSTGISLQNLATISEPYKEKGGWYADLEVDLRKTETKGGVFTFDFLTGNLVVSSTLEQGKTEYYPISLVVDHINPKEIAYATPNEFIFYNSKLANQPVFLINNNLRPLLFTCGKWLNKIVQPHSIEKVVVPASAESCTLQIDEKPAGEHIKITKLAVKAKDEIWLQQGTPGTFVGEKLTSFRDCSDKYCDCANTQNALQMFYESFMARVEKINAEEAGGNIEKIYPAGYAENVILRVFAFSLQTKSCELEVGGSSLLLKDGAYKLTAKAELSQSQLSGFQLAYERIEASK